METKVNFIVVGLFVLLLGVFFIAVVLWLSVGLNHHVTPKLYLSVINESVAGLNVDAPVKYQGVSVGKVHSITLNRNAPQQVILIFAINPDTTIKTDTLAVLETQGLTGIAYVELSGGTPAASILLARPGYPYPQITSKPSLGTRLENVLSTAMANLDHTTTNINAMLSDENRQSIRKILIDSSSLMTSLAAQKANISRGIRQAAVTMDNTAQASLKLDPLITRASASADAINAMANKLSDASAEAQKTAQEMGEGVHQVRTDILPDLQKLMLEIADLSITLKSLAEQTQQDPGSFLRGRKALPVGPGEIQTERVSP
ncbi:MlaD family protein [Undibacterium sp. Ji67W]|uniref:MlaD family protein n=1 Tax=Undibacterium sp. Ji67W TaxID=3413042 RepID=UPI003BF19CE2